MLSRMVGVTPDMTIHTDNGLVYIVNTHMVIERENPNKTQATGDIKLDGIVCVFPLKKDVIRIQWRQKNEIEPFHHQDLMYARDFKLDLKSMYSDRKLRGNACVELCRKIIEYINTHHNRKNSEGWLVLQPHEQIKKLFSAKIKQGKGTAYLTNLGVSFVHESEGIFFWMGYNQIISWRIHKSRNIRLEHQHLWWWKNTGKEEWLVTNSDFKIEDKTDPQLLYDTIYKCLNNSDNDTTRDIEEIVEITKSWQPKDFLDYGNYRLYDFYHTFYEELLQKWFKDAYLPPSFYKTEDNNKREIAKKYQNYCFWYVREKILADYAPAIAVNKQNTFTNSKTYPKIEMDLMALLVCCHALSIPTEQIFQFSDSFKETLKRGNEDVHKWSKEVDECVNHQSILDEISEKYQKLGKVEDMSNDKEFVFHAEQFHKHLLKQFVDDDWIKLVESQYYRHDSNDTAILDKDGKQSKGIMDPVYYNNNLTWIERYHPESPTYISDILYRNLYNIWKQEQPLTDYISDKETSWLDYQMDDLPYDIIRVNYDNGLVNVEMTRPMLKAFSDKAVVNSNELESFVTPEQILKADIISADCFYHYKDKIWFTRNPDVMPLLEDVATVSKNECESKYGFVGLGFSEDKVQKIEGIPAVMCSENVVAKLEYAGKSVPIMLKLITDEELTLELMDKYGAGEIHFSCFSLMYSLMNDGRYMPVTYRWCELRTKQPNDEEMLPLAERMRRNKFSLIVGRLVSVKKEDFG